MWSTIRSKIVDVIEDLEGSPIKQVCRSERSSFTGYPAVTVSPTEDLADYHETKPNSERGTFVFTVRAYYPFVDGQETADLELEKVVDVLRELFRNKKILGNVADWVAPANSVWGYQKRGDGEMRVADIKVQVIKYF